MGRKETCRVSSFIFFSPAVTRDYVFISESAHCRIESHAVMQAVVGAEAKAGRDASSSASAFSTVREGDRYPTLDFCVRIDAGAVKSKCQRL